MVLLKIAVFVALIMDMDGDGPSFHEILQFGPNKIFQELSRGHLKKTCNTCNNVVITPPFLFTSHVVIRK